MSLQEALEVAADLGIEPGRAWEILESAVWDHLAHPWVRDEISSGNLSGEMIAEIVLAGDGR